MKAALLLFEVALFGDLAQVRQSGPALDRIPPGWLLRGSHPAAYAVGLTEVEVSSGSKSAFLVSRDAEPLGFATLMQISDAIPDPGHRLRMTASVKAVEIGVRAGLWLRFDDADGKELVLENMEVHPIQGSQDWTRYELALTI
jgi:hypothetical protein